MIDMLQDFNLLISTSRRNEKNACSEMWYLLGEIGDKASEVTTTGIIGLTVAKTILDPKVVVRRLREILRQKPWEVKYVLKVVPIEGLISATIEDVAKAAAELSKKISDGETFRVTVEKRRSNLSSREIIEAVAKNIDKKVDLENPNKIVLIEVVGERVGLSLLEPDDILSVEKERRTL
jgi:tRNA acetyltransferase TAN1